jgi:hypothetical protein
MEDRYKMALESIIEAYASGEGAGSWLRAADAMKEIAKQALNPKQQH